MKVHSKTPELTFVCLKVWDFKIDIYIIALKI